MISSLVRYTRQLKGNGPEVKRAQIFWPNYLLYCINHDFAVFNRPLKCLHWLNIYFIHKYSPLLQWSFHHHLRLMMTIIAYKIMPNSKKRGNELIMQLFPGCTHWSWGLLEKVYEWPRIRMFHPRRGWVHCLQLYRWCRSSNRLDNQSPFYVDKCD